MADFKAHTSVGTLWGLLLGTVSVISDFCSLIGGIVILFLAATSSAAPDIDSDTGRPRELVLSFLGIAIPIVLFFNISDSTSSENILAATLISFFLVRYILGYLLAKFTVHRGLWHSVPAAVLCSEITYLLFFDLPVKVRLLYAIAVLGGFISHLLLDELYSVKVLALETKRSFGTALKFTGSSKIQTFFLYFLIFCSAVGCICI
jgi:membrane-bound metal-dependent hydrolase YbcI (DUF457 family)